MGNNCCSDLLNDEEILVESSENNSNVTSIIPITAAPRISTQQHTDQRACNTIIEPPPRRSTEQYTNYRASNTIIEPTPRRSTEQYTNYRACNTIIEPTTRRSTEQHTNYRERNNLINPPNVIASTKSTDHNISNRQINIVDRSSSATKKQPAPASKCVFVRSAEYVNSKISKEEKDLNRLVKYLQDWNYDEKFEKVYVNNSLQCLFSVIDIPMKKSVLDSGNVYELEKLDSNSWEYQEVEQLFFKTNKRFFKIHNIEKVHNPYLSLQYEIKKIEFTDKHIQFKEKIMYHGTKKSNVDSICQKNFDWRLNGTSRGAKFGKGVSFSPVAYYATHYGDATYNKVMIVANVLVQACCQGYRNMHIPQLGYDTSVNEKKHVYVKYDDNTFYPRYLIHYGGIDEKAANKKNRNNEQDCDCDNIIWDVI